MDEEAYTRSLKADIIPIINADLRISEDRLYSLSVEVLNELFNILQLKVISVERLRAIISNNSTSEAIMAAIMKEPRRIAPISTSRADPLAVEVPEVSPSPIRLPDSPRFPAPEPARTPSPVFVPEPSVPEVRTSQLSSNKVDVPEIPADYQSLSSEPLFSQDAIKADIIPVIQNYIDVPIEKLGSLSVNTLNQIFGILESGAIPNSDLESIIKTSMDSAEIESKIQAKLTTEAAPSDSLKEDLIIGILFSIPEGDRGRIEVKLREIEDVNELTELSQYALPELMGHLGFEAAAPGPYDEKADIRAGILAQLPPSLRGAIGDRLDEIDDLDQLYRLSQMNYVQVQQSLGLAPQSASEVPAEFVNPVDTATQRSSSTPTPSEPGAADAPDAGPTPEQKEKLQAQIREHREKNKMNVQIIQKMAEKVYKVKISDGGEQTPETVEVSEKLEIIMRAHPTRVENIVTRLKNSKDKNRFKALFEWYAYSHRIEEIETYVEHWQGQVQGIGGFRAAINVSRFDPVVEHMPTKEIQGLDIQAKRALERVHSSDLNVRASGVADIKQISNYLLEKATR